MKEKISRRSFFKVSSSLVAGAGVTVSAVSSASTAAAKSPNGTSRDYPIHSMGRADSLKVGAPLMFHYPDKDSPCAAVKIGRQVDGGVGPDNDIVAFSTLCTHMGCPVQYDGHGTFKCGCHFSQFDAEKSGQMVCGQATVNLPNILLNYDANTGGISAVGVTGLIYGRHNNVL